MNTIHYNKYPVNPLSCQKDKNTKRTCPTRHELACSELAEHVEWEGIASKSGFIGQRRTFCETNPNDGPNLFTGMGPVKIGNFLNFDFCNLIFDMILPNEPNPKMNKSTITYDMEIAYDNQPSNQDPKKRTQFVPIFDKICAIGEICGFDFYKTNCPEQRRRVIPNLLAGEGPMDQLSSNE